MLEDNIKFYKPNIDSDVTVLDAHISSFKYDMHSHDDYAIGMTYDGIQSFKCKGSNFKVRKGGIIQINPEEPHDGFAINNEGYSYKMFYIPRRFVCDMNFDSKTIFRFDKTVTYDPSMVKRFMEFASVLHFADSCVEDKENALQNFVLDMIDQNDVNTVKIESKASSEIIERSIGYIYQNIENRLDIDEIAQAMCMSKFHFIRMFKKATFRTPYQFILDLKLDLARKDLELGYDLKNVATKFGFYDLSHFIKRFKNTFGVTPYIYQKNLF